jgi:hypothetical protein
MSDVFANDVFRSARKIAAVFGVHGESPGAISGFLSGGY